MAKPKRWDQLFKKMYEDGIREFHEEPRLGENDDISGLTFDKITVYEGSFIKASLAKTTFKRATFIQSTWSHLRGPGLVMDGVKMDGCRLDQCFFEDAELSGSRWRHVQALVVDFSNANLAGASFSSCGLRESVFHETDLTGATFDSVDLVACGFTNVRAQGANLQTFKCFDLVLADSDLSKAVLRGALFSDVAFEANIITGTDFTDADFRKADLSLQDGLEGAILTGAKYSAKTLFPDGFDPRAHGMKLVAS